MKRMSRYSRASRVLVLLLCALLLAGMLPSYGALGASKRTSKGVVKNDGETRSVTVTLANKDKLPENAKVEYTLYKIGVPAPDTAAGWQFDTRFDNDENNYGRKIIEFDSDKRPKQELQEIVDALAEEIVNGDYKFEYAHTEKLSNGSATFKELADGIYLGVLPGAHDARGENSPLFTTPS